MASASVIFCSVAVAGEGTLLNSGAPPEDSARTPREDPHATVEEAALATGCLVALPGVGYEETARTLRTMAERASSRRGPGE